MKVQMVAFEILEDEDFTLLTFKVPTVIAAGMAVGVEHDILFPLLVPKDVKAGQKLLFEELEWT